MGFIVGAVAGAFASTEISAVVGGVLGSVLGGIGGAVVSGLVGRMLGVGKQSQPQPLPASALINATSNVGAIGVIYGSRLVGGAQLPPMVVGANNATLVLVTILGEGQIQAIRTTYFSGVPSTDPRFAGQVIYEGKYVGTPTQAADPWLLANVPGWSANDRFLGCAYLVHALNFNQTAFPNGMPTVTADVDGRLLYDPRDGGTRFSNNPALAIRDYHANAIYGRNAPSANIDDGAFSTAANDCEARVALPNAAFLCSTPSSGQLTFSANQSFTLGAEVQLATTGTFPSPLVANATYFVIPVDSTTIRLAATAANAAAGVNIPLTTSGTGVCTIIRAPVFVADPGTGLIHFDHDEVFGLGDGVQCLTNGALPGGLSPGTTYYFIPRGVGSKNGLVNGVGVTLAGLSMNCGLLATSYANALAGTAIALTTGGSGVHALCHVDMARYTCDGVLNPDDGWLNNLRGLLASCRGIRPFTGGKFRLTIDKLTAPTALGFTEDNIVGAWTIHGRGKKTSFNRVTAQFYNPAKNWQPDLAVYDSTADRAVDNGLLLESKISLDYTTNYFRAMMIAQIDEQQSRFGVVVQFIATIAGMQCEVGDVVPITESGYGWVAKPFRILQMELYSSDEVQVTCVEYDDSIYNVSSLPQARTYLASKLPDPFTISRQIPPNVSGLEVFGQGSNGNFYGKNCLFSWRRASNTGSYEVGSEPFGADGGLLDYYFKDFEVKIYKNETPPAALLRTEYVQDAAYTYTYEHNSEDNNGAPQRSFSIEVRQRTKYDKISQIAAQLTVTNPAPALTTLTVTPSFNDLGVTYPKPADLDWNGLRLYVSTTNGFTPGPANLVYDGVDAAFTVKGLSESTTYYYVYALSDSFGYGDNSAQGSFTTPANIAATTALWTGVSGTGKPADNATKNIITRSASGSPPGTPGTGDLWYQTDTYNFLKYNGASWDVVGNAYSNTNQLTDGAGLGTTALWTGVSGTGKPADNATKNVVTHSVSSSPPSSPTQGDIWFQTDTHGDYEYNGSAWVLVSDITANKQAATIAGQGALATLNAVGTAQITDANVTTAKIASNAVTQVVSAYTAGSVATNNTTNTSVQSVTITTAGGGVFVLGTLNAVVDTANDNAKFYIYRDSTNLANSVTRCATNGVGYAQAVSVTDQPAAGTYTYYLYGINSNSTGSAWVRSLIVLETKR